VAGAVAPAATVGIARSAKPMTMKTAPTTAAMAATPNATTEVNSEAWRKDAFMTVVRLGSVWGSSA
jgi:hypothetical protein